MKKELWVDFESWRYEEVGVVSAMGQWLLDGNQVLSNLPLMFLRFLCAQAGWWVWRAWEQETRPAYLQLTFKLAECGRIAPVVLGSVESAQYPEQLMCGSVVSPSRSKKGAKRTWWAAGWGPGMRWCTSTRLRSAAPEGRPFPWWKDPTRPSGWWSAGRLRRLRRPHLPHLWYLAL